MRTGGDPDGPVDKDPHRKMFTLPSCFNRLLSSSLMQRFRNDNLLGHRDLLELRLFVSYPNGKTGRTHCDDNPLDPVYILDNQEDHSLLAGILAIEPDNQRGIFMVEARSGTCLPGRYTGSEGQVSCSNCPPGDEFSSSG